MKFLTEYMTFNTKKRREFINITRDVDKALQKSGIKEGMILVSAMHITSGIFVNDAEPGLHRDIEEWLLKLIPEGHDYYHHRTGEVNGDAHLRNLLIGHEVIIPVTDGKLDLGPWQKVFYAEFDGQRSKRLVIKVMGD
ncbi:MAG: secondary thiamine-phosphate synthase enzyme YjbQ [Candidatus Roizmanbacteria bacterium]|nr:secondary thiamine-phosphate synthase enzyme YjbQ [Candidatus Roizmanbacteria bacterium]